MVGRVWALGAGLLLLAACDREVPGRQYGESVFNDPKISTSPFNVFSCATCHSVQAGQPGVIATSFDSGYNLANVVGRSSFWGGYETTLLAAINTCLDRFMGGRRLTADDKNARALYDYLDSLSPEPQSPPVPFTIVRNVTGLDQLKGDKVRGFDVWERGCTRCHGQPRTGAGRISDKASRVPDDIDPIFAEQLRTVVVEKVRHGRFFGLTGVMPLYSAEVMTDAQLADLLAYIGL
jgi:thiosulfate dehydrogenase